MFDTKTLEFDKVLNMIKDYCFLKATKENLNNLDIASTKEDVLELLDETDEAIKIIVKYGPLPISNFNQVNEAILRTSKGGVLEVEEILDVLALINSSLEINKYLNNIFNESKEDYSSLNKYNLKFINLSKLKNLLSFAVSPEGKIFDQASKNLMQIRRKINLAENRLRQTLNLLMQENVNKLNELLIVIRDNRMCLPVKIEYKNSFKGIVHDVSSSNTTCYIEPADTFVIGNELDNLREEEFKEIKKILEELSLLISANSEQLLNNYNLIIKLDLIFAKAVFSKENPKPKISNDYSFNLQNVCHPLINKDNVVPISIRMQNKDNVIIITGPNTGGKTVTLKTVGLLSLMVQAGIFPNSKKDSTYFVFKNILADIGDEQSIEESLSTFSSHITKVIKILANDLNSSLILLDELGSGTDPKEGSALAIALIKHLKNNNAKAIITTHYTDLKNFAYQNEGIVNASVEFNTITLKPTYKILLGIPGSSNALDIASNLGLNQDIIVDAKSIIDAGPINQDVLNYESKMQGLQEKLDEYEQNNLKLEEALKEVNKEKLYLEKERNNLLQKAKKEADNIISKAKEEAFNILNELKEMKKEAEIKEHILANLKNKVNNLETEDINSTLFNEDFKVGDFVKIIPYDKVGKILAINKDRYKVNFGQFTMDFKKKDLLKTEVKETKVVKKPKLTGYNSISGASIKLDLRGKRYEEVKNLVEDFIDKATLANYECVNIIHGFGTGVVRQRVWEVLKQNPNVKSYRYGGEGEGLNGATVVYLK